MENFTKSKTYTIVFCAAVFILAAFAAPVSASSLPEELGDWRLSSEHVTNLTASEDLGKWTSASYVRSGPPGLIEVQLTEGTGPGALFVPEGAVSSGYETLDVKGMSAVLERDAVTGQALAVDMGSNNNGPRTATFESRGVSKEELIAFAESMIEALAD